MKLKIIGIIIPAIANIPISFIPDIFLSAASLISRFLLTGYAGR